MKYRIVKKRLRFEVQRRNKLLFFTYWTNAYYKTASSDCLFDTLQEARIRKQCLIDSDNSPKKVVVI